MSKMHKDLKFLKFKYDLLKKVLEERSRALKKELGLKEKELQIWKRYAMSQKSREDRLREYIEHLYKKNKDL